MREGELARERLVRRRASADLTWENLPERSASAVDAATSADARDCHARWLALLAEAVRLQCRCARPGTLTPDNASSVVDALSETYRTTPRMLSFFRRVWLSVGLDPDVWPTRASVRGMAAGAEHYRRLSVAEVRGVHEELVKRAPRLADMLLIGYSTGLRLSDVVDLELSEVALPFLRVVPNKTRCRKPKPLHVPLTDEALAVIERLKSASERTGRTFLFEEDDRRRTSRRIAAAFRRAGVLKQGPGRASFHSLRATFISLMDESGVPPHITDSITGHGGGGMHARYTQPCDEALRTAVMRAIRPVNVAVDPIVRSC